MAEPQLHGAINDADRRHVATPVVERKGKNRWRGRLAAFGIRVFVRPVIAAFTRWPHLPWPFGLVDALMFWLPALPGTSRTRVRLGECRGELQRARGASGDRILLHMHGGGFLTCGLNVHRRLISSISRASGATVLNVAYRMLPKAPISTAVEDGVHAYRWLLEQGYDPSRIVLSGDSAGGYLAFMVALGLRDQGLPRPAGVIALSPFTNFDLTGKLEHPNAERDPLFPKNSLEAIGKVADRAEARVRLDGELGPRISPVDADLTGLPPVLIQVAAEELLLPDAELMTERLGTAGVPATLQIWQTSLHVFQAGADLLPEGRAALRDLGTFVREHTPEAV